MTSCAFTTILNEPGCNSPTLLPARSSACDKYNAGGCQPESAKLLRPRMARADDLARGTIAGYGLKLMPSLSKAKLDPDQREIFNFYGYPKEWWDPALSNPAANRWAT